MWRKLYREAEGKSIKGVSPGPKYQGWVNRREGSEGGLGLNRLAG